MIKCALLNSHIKSMDNKFKTKAKKQRHIYSVQASLIVMYQHNTPPAVCWGSNNSASYKSPF